jgi:hypothetical protein
MTIEEHYYEYECGGLCSPDGCLGHEDKDIIVGISVNGVYFDVDGHAQGDYPGGGHVSPSEVKKAVAALKMLLTLKESCDNRIKMKGNEQWD